MQIVLRIVCLWLACAPLSSYAQSAGASQKAVMPRVFLLDAKQLQAARQLLQDNDPHLAEAWARLDREAKQALKSGTFSVTSKAVTPPSGDKHDYMSQAPYFWP